MIRINEDRLKQIIIESVRKKLTENIKEEITIQDIKEIVDKLDGHPMPEKFWPQNFNMDKDGRRRRFVIQRIESNQMPVKRSSELIRDDEDDEYGGVTLYSYGPGYVLIQIGRQENVPWYEDNGYTYMIWGEDFM